MKDMNVVRVSNALTVLGFVIFALFTGGIAFCVFTQGWNYALVIPMILALAGLCYSVSCLTYCIWYDDDGFTYRNFLGVKKSYTYDQITAQSQSHIHIGEEKIYFDMFAENGIDFGFLICDKYRELHREDLPYLDKNGQVIVE